MTVIKTQTAPRGCRKPPQNHLPPNHMPPHTVGSTSRRLVRQRDAPWWSGRRTIAKFRFGDFGRDSLLRPFIRSLWDTSGGAGDSAGGTATMGGADNRPVHTLPQPCQTVVRAAKMVRGRPTPYAFSGSWRGGGAQLMPALASSSIITSSTSDANRPRPPVPSQQHTTMDTALPAPRDRPRHRPREAEDASGPQRPRREARRAAPARRRNKTLRRPAAEPVGQLRMKIDC